MKDDISSNKREVAKLIKEIKGDRSIRQMSADTGVATSYLSSIMREINLPSANVLKKIVEKDKDPKIAVSLDELMIAAGYQVALQESYDDSDIHETEKNNDSEDDSDTEITKSRSGDETVESDGSVLARNVNRSLHPSRTTFYERRMIREKFVSLYRMILNESLLRKNVAIHYQVAEEHMRGRYVDYIYEIDYGREKIENWMKFLILDERGARFTPYEIRNALGNLIFLPVDVDRKVSIVTNNEKCFNRFMMYRNKLSFKGNLSVVLISTEDYSVIEEEYIAFVDADAEERFKDLKIK